MAIPAILAALGRASSATGTLARGGPGAPPPLPGASGRGFFEGTQKLQAMSGEASKLATSIGQVTPSFKGFVGALTAFPSKILEVKNQLVTAGQTYIAALAAPITGIKELGDSLGAFTRLSNPSQFKRFTYTVENTFATLGRSFEGPMEGLIRAARTVGDVFAKLRPALAPAMQAVEMFTDAMAKNFVAGAKTWAPIIQNIGYAMMVGAKAFELFSARLRAFHGTLARITAALGIGNLMGKAFDEDAKSDVAVREPRYMSSQDIAREMAQNALMASAGGPKETPAMQTVTRLDTLISTITNLISDLTAWFGPGWPAKLAEALINAHPLNQAKNAADKKLADSVDRIALWLARQGLL
jgi:hypothetical protein